MSSPQLSIVLLLAAYASFGHAFDARFLNKTHHSPSLVHWNSSIDLMDTKQTNLSHVFVYPLNEAKLSLQVTHRFHTLSFKLKSRTAETVCNITFDGLFTAKPSLREKCPVASLSGQTSADPLFIHLTVNSHSDGFAIWDIVADETVHLSISHLSVRRNSLSSGTPLETFIYQTSKTNANASVYFSLLVDPDLPDGTDRCLTVSSSLDGTQITTFYALETWASSNRSLKVTREDGAFCLRNELFAQCLGQVQVTFTVTNLAKLSSEFAVNGKPILFTVVSAWADGDAIFGRVHNPGFEVISSGDKPWLFYNRELFNYNVASDSSKAIHICDMLANCYQMEEVVNGTKDWDGSKPYTVPEKVHNQLKYTPVVRLLADDPKATLKKQYFNGQDETASRVLSHLTSKGIPAKLDSGFRLRYATNSTISKPKSSHAPNILFLPMHLIDQRPQQFTVTLNCSQSNLYLESIRLQFGSGSSLNHTYLNLSLPIGDSKTFTTQDFFKPKIHALPSAGTQLTGLQIAYRAIGGKALPEGNEVEVGVAIDVDLLYHYQSNVVFDNFRPEVKFEVFSGGQDVHSSSLFDGQKSFTLTKANSTALILSNWIPANPVPDTDSWVSNQGHVRLAYRSVDGKVNLHQGDLRVKQIIWGFAEKDYVEEKELAHREDAGNYFYEEIRMQRKLLNDRYRIGYLISLKEGVQVGAAAGVRVDFESNFEEITNALPSSPLCSGPTYGDVICRVEPYTCPEHYFKVNQDTGICEMVNN